MSTCSKAAGLINSNEIAIGVWKYVNVKHLRLQFGYNGENTFQHFFIFP